MNRLISIGMIIAVVACSETNPLAMTDTSTGGTDATTTTMSTTIGPPTTSTTASTTSMTDPVSTDPGSTETGSESTTTSAESSTGVTPCDPVASACVPAAPEGWSGPSALRSTPADDGDGPGCGGEYAELGIVAYADYNPGSADCDCACAEPKDVECIYPVPMGGDNSVNCTSPINTINVTNACQQLPANLQIAGNNYWSATSGIESGSCTPLPTANIVPAAFEDRLTVCDAGVVEQLDCEDGQVCAPLPDEESDGNICIWQNADVECPDEWPSRTLAHQGLMGVVSCSACTCGDVTGECSGAIYLFGTTDCSVMPLVNVPIAEDSCHQGGVANTMRSVRIATYPEPVDPECQPSLSVPVGSVDTTGPVTVCCVAP